MRYSQAHIGGNHQIREFVGSSKSILNYAIFCVDCGVHFKIPEYSTIKFLKLGKVRYELL